ncbi:MAG: hypothetical protein ACR2QC_00235 [Gammaproteobacteria bacterium]
MKAIYSILAAVFAVLGFLLVGGCAEQSGARLREIERFSEMSDSEIDAAKEACYLISTTDYNCANLVPAEHGMTTEEWEALHSQTKICRKNQRLSYDHCLRGKGVRYSEFN